MKTNNDMLRVATAFAIGVIVVMIGFTLSNSNSSIIANNFSQSPAADREACDMPFPNKPDVTQTRYDNGDVIVVTNTPVYIMKPGTIGKLCITYTELAGGQAYSGKVYSQVANVADTKNVTITPHPTNITEKNYYFANAIDALQNKHSFDVVYDISAPHYSKGFYGIWPLGVCPGLPFAIGYDASEINYSLDFPWEAGPFYGCSGFIDEKIVGVSGIEVSYITNQSKSNIGYEITGVQTSITRFELLPSPPPAANASITNMNTTSAVIVTFTVHFHTYSATFNVVADARDFEIAHFSGNPQLEKIGQCSWVPTNGTAIDLPDAVSIYDDRYGHNTKYVKIDSMPEKIPAHTNDSTYTFNITLANLPESYYALQPAIFITDEKEPVDEFGSSVSNGAITNFAGSAIADYFPVTIGDKLSSPIITNEQGVEKSASGGLYGVCS